MEWEVGGKVFEAEGAAEFGAEAELELFATEFATGLDEEALPRGDGAAFATAGESERAWPALVLFPTPRGDPIPDPPPEEKDGTPLLSSPLAPMTSPWEGVGAKPIAVERDFEVGAKYSGGVPGENAAPDAATDEVSPGKPRP